MKNYNILSKINTYLKVLGGTIGIASGFVLAAIFLLKLHFRLISVVSIIISEYKNAKDITGINALNLIFIMLIFGASLGIINAYFIDLPDTLFFHDTEFDNFVNFRTGINIFPVY